MGGLAGIFHLQTPKPVDPQRLGVMTDALAHRGPDGRGVWTAPGVGLGHRRLAVIDPDGGAQPIIAGDGALAVVLDGEILNFRAVRAELEAQGAQFRTRSDAEVILHGWRLWGTDCVRHFDGMFAIALYDRRQDCLFLARDRLGQKPLVYTELADGCLLVASELKGLLAHPLFRRMPDIRAAEDYLAYGYVPDDRSLLAGVRKLPAGHHVTIQRGRALPAPVTWWDISFAERSTASVARLEEELVDIVRMAVTSRMRADVPLGAILSGGIESAAMVALMAESSGKAVSTSAIGLEDGGDGDARHATSIAERFATRHSRRTIAVDDGDAIDPLVALFDEPFADAAALVTIGACGFARETVTVALSGNAAADFFAARSQLAAFRGEARTRAVLPAGFRHWLFGGLDRLCPDLGHGPRALRSRTLLRSLASSDGEAYAAAQAVLSGDMRRKLFSAEALHVLGSYRAEDRYIRAMASASARNPVDRAHYADIKIGLPANILTRMDRGGMAAGLEIREPLLDYRLLEFDARLPVSMRMRGKTGQWLLRRAMRRYLPEDMRYRQSQPVAVPLDAWFRGSLAGAALKLVQGSALAETGWFDMAAIARLVDEHQRGSRDHGAALWQILMLDRSLKRIFTIG